MRRYLHLLPKYESARSGVCYERGRRRAYLDEECRDVRNDEHECYPLWTDEHVLVTAQRSRETAKQHVFCGDETTWGKRDKEVLHNVQAAAVWMSGEAKTDCDAKGIS